MTGVPFRAAAMAALVLLAESGCSTKTVEMRNPTTGETTSCSISSPPFASTFTRSQLLRLDDCIQEQKRSGYRVVEQPK